MDIVKSIRFHVSTLDQAYSPKVGPIFLTGLVNDRKGQPMEAS